MSNELGERGLVQYPYLPEGRSIAYVPGDNKFMREAAEWALHHSLDKSMPTASVIVKEGEVIGRGANGSPYHDTHECVRVTLGNLKTGEGYELCEGCHPKNHSEAKAIADTLAQGKDPKGADLYLWGHWWCCEACWKAMIEAGINQVFLLEKSEILFNKLDPNNIVGHQFDLLR